MEIKRRDFLKIAAGGGLLLASGAAETALAARPPKKRPAGALGILYDANVCIGCKACVSACKQYNDMPPDHSSAEQLWDNPIDLSGKTLNIIKLYKDGDGSVKNREENGYSYVKRHCMHCVDPACVSACPVTALTKNPDSGIVSYNKDACIGCRYCQVACPFEIPKFQWDEPFPQIKKCQLCSHRIEKGGYAACCEFCPTGASVFGKVDDLLEEAKRRLALVPGEEYEFPVGTVTSTYKLLQKTDRYVNRIYGEKEGGGTQYLMLSGVQFEKLGLPPLDDIPQAAVSEGLQHSIYKGMIAPIALLGVLMAAAYKNTRGKGE